MEIVDWIVAYRPTDAVIVLSALAVVVAVLWVFRAVHEAREDEPRWPLKALLEKAEQEAQRDDVKVVVRFEKRKAERVH